MGDSTRCRPTKRGSCAPAADARQGEVILGKWGRSIRIAAFAAILPIGICARA